MNKLKINEHRVWLDQHKRSRTFEHLITRSWNFRVDKETDNSVYGYLKCLNATTAKQKEKEFEKLCKITGAAFKRLEKLVPGQCKQLEHLGRRLPVITWVEQLDCLYTEALELTQEIIKGK